MIATSTTSEAEIRALIEADVNAVRAMDITMATANYAPDVVLFDLLNPLQNVGAEALRKRLEDWFSSFQGPIGYDVRDLNVVAGDDVAFCHSFNHVHGTKKDGEEIDMWWRATVCYRKIDGRWLATHAHSSVPFDAGSGKASIELKP